MNRQATLAKVEAQVRQLSCLGLPGPVIAPQVFRALNAVLPFETCGHFWLGGPGQSDAYFNSPEVGVGLQLYQQSYFRRRESEVWATIDEALAQRLGPHHVTRALKVPIAAFRRHPIYNEILRPSGYGVFLRMALGDATGPVCMFGIARQERDRDFDAADLRTFERLAPFLVMALRSREAVATEDDCHDDRALLIVDRTGALRWSSPAALRLLSLAAGSSLAPPVLPDGVLRAVRSLQRVAAADLDAPAPVWEHANAWGRFVARAYWLDPHEAAESLIGIELERRVPLPVRVYEAVRDRHLPPAQAAVCLPLALGDSESESEIAAQLGISRNTVVYHRRQIYNRLGVDSRRELRERLLSVSTAST